MPYRFGILILLLSMSAPLSAQRGPRVGLATNFGYSRSDSEPGAGLALGASVRWSHFIGFAMPEYRNIIGHYPNNDHKDDC